MPPCRPCSVRRRPRRGAWRPGRREGHDVSPVAQRHERAFGPAIPSSITTRRRLPRSGARELRLDVGDRLASDSATKTPLPAASPSVFTTRARAASAGSRWPRPPGRMLRSEPSARRLRPTPLHEGLRPLEPAPSAPGPTTDLPWPEPVGQPVDQGGLGADDDQVGVDLARRDELTVMAWPSARCRACRGCRVPPPRRRCAPACGRGRARAPCATTRTVGETALTLCEGHELLAPRADADQAHGHPDLLAKKAT